MKFYQKINPVILLLLSFVFNYSYAFRSSNIARRKTLFSVSVSVATNPDSVTPSNIRNLDDEKSYALTRDDVKALIKVGKEGNTKIVNPFGAWCALVSILTGPLWMMAMSTLNLIYKYNKNIDQNRSIYDATGKIWAKVWLRLTNCYPGLSGNLDYVKRYNGPCLYVANHASWMDIPVLCTVLDPVFKFIAKGELEAVPCIGQQLVGVSD